MSDKNTRIAIVSEDKCKPKKCRQECKRSCPVVKTGKLCIEVLPTSKIAFISENLCIGCGICVKKCPFDAIQIINLPTNLDSQVTHRYSANSFKLHRLPTPRPGQVLGLVGTNGIGKSTALKILAGKQKPNLGRYDDPPEWQEIIRYFRGSELQNYFTKMLEDDIKAIIKPQYVDNIPRAIKGPVQKVGELLKLRMEKPDDIVKQYIKILELKNVLKRDVSALSGGELQRFAIGMSCVQEADVYMFDEPSSYLDVKQPVSYTHLDVYKRQDGKYSYCITYFSFRDIRTMQTMIQKDKNLDRENKEKHLNKLQQVMAYCDNVTDCRRKLVLSYFNEDFDSKSCHKNCDNCRNSANVINEERAVSYTHLDVYKRQVLYFRLFHS